MPCERMHDRKPQRQTLAWPAPKKHELRRQRPRQRQEIAEHAPQKCGLTLAETNTIPTSPDTQEKKIKRCLWLSAVGICAAMLSDGEEFGLMEYEPLEKNMIP